MNGPAEKKSFKPAAHVDTVVQEYMDNLLGDLFPEISEPETIQSPVEELELQTSAIDEPVIKEPAVRHAVTVPAEVKNLEIQTPAIVEPLAETIVKKVAKVKTVVIPPVIPIPVNSATKKTDASTVKSAINEAQNKTQLALADSKEAEPLRYPDAPVWAQESIDVLLFDVCGLKLAVSMESLGSIIKVENECNHLIGRPDWFIGSYQQGDQSLYVVDTAKYIMPEKGFDLTEQGFPYLIQLQRSKWALACKSVQTTVRIEPNQVKWRSQQGKRKWLAGTVIEHMCALIHVDSLVELLESEAS